MLLLGPALDAVGAVEPDDETDDDDDALEAEEQLNAGEFEELELKTEETDELEDAELADEPDDCDPLQSELWNGVCMYLEFPDSTEGLTVMKTVEAERTIFVVTGGTTLTT